MKTTIVWRDAAKEVPDDEQTVLIATDDRDVWMGFLDAGYWCYVDAVLVSANNVRVTHWANLPEPPSHGRP